MEIFFEVINPSRLAQLCHRPEGAEAFLAALCLYSRRYKIIFRLNYLFNVIQFH